MKKMIATMLVLIAVVVVLAQESPLFKATHVYTNTTPIESITYDTGVAVTSEIANTKYAVKLEEFDNLGTWVDIGQAMYMDPALIYTSNQVLMSVSTNYVVANYVTQVIIGVDTTVSPYVTNAQYVAATSNAVAITTNHVTRYKLNVEIDDLATRTYVTGLTGATLAVVSDEYVTKEGTTEMTYGAIVSNLYTLYLTSRTGTTNNLAVTGPGVLLGSLLEGTYTNAGAYNSKTSWAKNSTNRVFYSTNELRYVWWESLVDTNVVGWATNSVSATSPLGIYAGGITGVATSAWETFVYSTTELSQDNAVSYDLLDASYMSVSLTNLFPVDTTNVWVFEKGLLKSHSTLP